MNRKDTYWSQVSNSNENYYNFAIAQLLVARKVVKNKRGGFIIKDLRDTRILLHKYDTIPKSEFSALIFAPC